MGSETNITFKVGDVVRSSKKQFNKYLYCLITNVYIDNKYDYISLNTQHLYAEGFNNSLNHYILCKNPHWRIKRRVSEYILREI